MPTYKAILGQVSDYDIRLLKIFKAVVEHHGMAAAELELNIGLSTISRHVKDLEERVEKKTGSGLELIYFSANHSARVCARFG